MFKSAFLAATMVASASISFAAETADAVISKHIAAIGGLENWKKVNSIRYTGSLSVQGMSMPISQTVVNGKAMRVEFNVMGATNYIIVTDKEGWSYMPVQGQQEVASMPAEEVKEYQGELDIAGDLIDYAAKGTKVVLAGKEKQDGTEVYKLTLTTKAGEEKTIFIDATTHYLVRKVEKVDVQGQKMDDVTKYGDYKKLAEGIVVPMSVESSVQGPMTFSNIEVNPKIDESIFKPSK